MKLMMDKFKTTRGRLTLTGVAMTVLGIMELPAPVLADPKLFSACLGGALVGLGFTLTFFAVTDSADLKDVAAQQKESKND